jgi:hypothetical protein
MNTDPKILAGAVPPRTSMSTEKERVIARPKGGKSNFAVNKKKLLPGFFGKK